MDDETDDGVTVRLHGGRRIMVGVAWGADLTKNAIVTLEKMVESIARTRFAVKFSVCESRVQL